MAFYDKFPYTNFQELNLDWLTQEVSKVRDNRDASDASAAAALESERAAKASETEAAASAQASQQNANDSQQSADASQQSAENAAETVSNTLAQVNTLQARVDNIIPSGTQTEGNTELLDIRVSYDGTKYQSAGDSVREQSSDNNNMSNLLNLKTDAITPVANNIFNGEYITGYAILTTNVFTATEGGVVAVIPCSGNTTYFIKVWGAANRFTVGCGTQKLPVNQEVKNITTDMRKTGCYAVTTDASAKYLYVYVSNQNETPTMYVGKTEIFDNILYEAPIKADLSAETGRNLSAHTIKNLCSKYILNLFDGNYISDCGLLGLGVAPGNGLFTKLNGSRTIIVPVKPNTKYYFRSFGTHNRIRYGMTEKFPVLGDTVYLNVSAPTAGNVVHPITTESNSNWLIITITNQGEEPNAQVTENIDYGSFLGYNNMIQSKEQDNTKYYFIDDIEGTFESDTLQALDASKTRISDIYSIYDALVVNHPNYVSKTVLGTVSTENLEMRKYVFNSLRIQNNSAYSLKKPKLVFIAGIHGYEQGSSYCLAKVMQQITNGTDSISKFIRDNIEIVIVPVANPYGYNHNQRKNENGVDLNRNFTAGWTSSADPSSDYYGGASPASETETQLLTSLLNDNDDAYYAVDFHNIANGYPLMYLYSDSQVQFCNSLFNTLTEKWLSEYTGFPTDRLLGYCNTGVNACFAKQARSIGVDAFVAEAPWVMPVIGKTQYDVPTLTIGADVFGNIMAMLAKSMV